MKKVLKTRVGAQIVKPGVHIKHSKSYAVFIDPFSQPEEGLILIAEAYVRYRKVETINMFALCQTLQLVDQFQGLIALSQPGQGIRQMGLGIRTAVTDLNGFPKRSGGLSVLAF